MEQRLFSLLLLRGHLEVVRFLVESGANKDQGGQTMEERLFSLMEWALEVVPSPVPTKTKAQEMKEQRLFSLLLTRGTLKLSDFWLSRVPTKTKARQTMEQRLFSLQLTKGTLKLSDFWLSRVPTKTKAGQVMEQTSLRGSSEWAP